MLRIPTDCRRFTSRSSRRHSRQRQFRSRRLAVESLEQRQMLSHSPIEFNPPGLPPDSHELPSGLTVTHQTHWINGEPFDVVTTFIAPMAGGDGGASGSTNNGALHPLTSLLQLHSN